MKRRLRRFLPGERSPKSHVSREKAEAKVRACRGGCTGLAAPLRRWSVDFHQPVRATQLLRLEPIPGHFLKVFREKRQKKSS
jgi:hypothetical protein